MIVIVSLSGALLQTLVCFEPCLAEAHKTFRPRISSYYTGLSPRSLRRARSGKYDPTSFEREIGPGSFSISAINRNFLLPRCSEQQLGSSRYQFSRCIARCSRPCSFAILNFNERHFYRLAVDIFSLRKFDGSSLLLIFNMLSRLSRGDKIKSSKTKLEKRGFLWPIYTSLKFN